MQADAYKYHNNDIARLHKCCLVKNTTEKGQAHQHCSILDLQNQSAKSAVWSGNIASSPLVHYALYGSPKPKPLRIALLAFLQLAIAFGTMQSQQDVTACC